LLADEANHPLKLAVAQAKEFIAADAYKRLLLLQNISRDKANFAVFLDALARVLSALHTENIKKEKYRNAEKILNLRRAVENALAQLEHSSNVRLTSLSLALNSAL
jgi:hypothetical protein